MSTDLGSGDAVAPRVVTAVLVRDPSAVGEGLDALAGQVYESTATIVVGGGSAAKAEAERRDLEWLDSVADLRVAVPANATYVWFTSERVRPRPDALSALVAEAQRVDASVAGSKALQLDDPDVLVSVGIATDVFAVPYLGIEHDEVDQAQFDVIRDVGAASADSLLVRRDLLAGLRGPDPELAPQAAGIDFSFRARLRGARIVVVPSSEVLVPTPSRRAATPWIEEAGRIRAMMKSYSAVTLLWALPLAFVLGFIEAVVSPLLGRFTLFRWLGAWLWNLWKLPSTIAARLAARRGRVAGDEELFRFQVRGSARLRSLFEEAGDLVQERLAAGRVGGLSNLIAAGQSAVRSAGFLWGLGAVVAVGLATRSIWAGRLPAVGYSLLPAEDAGDVLGAYAGGWNPAGLGTIWPLRPAVGLIALVQRILFDRPELTATVLTMAALLFAAFGVARLLRGLGLSAAAAYAGGIVAAVGPGTAALGDTTQWTALLAMGAVPWVVRLALRPWPAALRSMTGRASALVLASGVAAAFLPAAVFVAPAMALVWALVGAGERWWAPLRAAVAAAAALPLLFPWLGIIDGLDYLRAGDPGFWTPSVWLVGAFGVAAFATITVGDRLLSGIAAWGGLVAVGGAAVARLGDAGVGVDPALAGLIAVSLGVGLVLGAAFEVVGQLDLPGWPRTVGAIGAAGAVLVALAAVPVILPGRAGLPGDELRDLMSFTDAISEDPARSRALLVGDAASLPGDSRSLGGTSYRVVSAPVPGLWEARLGPERQADEALDATLRSIIAGETARAGASLGEFGIEWIVFTDETPLDSFFAGQLDLLPLPGLDETAFVNEEMAARAELSSGDTWSWDGPAYSGPAGQAVRVAEAADQRWGPGEWAQSGWANEVAASTGVASFAGRPALRNEALFALVYLVVLVAASAAGVERRRR